MAYRVIHVGTGGFGASWCRDFLPAAVRAGLIEVAAAVDVNPAALENARRHLHLPPERCYTDIHAAFAENQTDICTIVVPPAHHEAVAMVALDHKAHILSEKPIADTLHGALRIVHRAQATGCKMAITMSHRYAQDKTTLRRLVAARTFGPVDYIICSLTCELRRAPTWGVFRYQAPDIQFTEAGVHRLDLLADLAGAPCVQVYAQAWNPAWSEFRSNPQALVFLEFENGVRAVYEGAATNAVGLYPFANEAWRVECEQATLLLKYGRVECFRYDPAARGATAREGSGETMPLLEQPYWGHVWLIRQFVEWLDGGPPMATRVETNLHSVAISQAAIESSRTGQPERIADLMRRVEADVLAAA
jgi:predicted dehydrogenase